MVVQTTQNEEEQQKEKGKKSQKLFRYLSEDIVDLYAGYSTYNRCL